MNIGEEVGMGGGGRKVARRVGIVINTVQTITLTSKILFSFVLLILSV